MNSVAEDQAAKILHAVKDGNFDKVIQLIQHGVDIHIWDTDVNLSLWGDTSIRGGNALMTAAEALKEAEEQRLEDLVSRGVSLQHPSMAGHLPDASLQEGRKETERWRILRYLLESRADPNAKSESGRYPMTIACKMGSEQMASVLIDHRAEVHVQNKTGWWAFIQACERDNIALLGLLLHHRADINCTRRNNYTALMDVASDSNRSNHMHTIDVFRFLIEQRSDLNVQNIDGETAMHLCINNLRLEMLNLLVAAKAYASVRSKRLKHHLYWRSACNCPRQWRCLPIITRLLALSLSNVFMHVSLQQDELSANFLQGSDNL